MHTRKIGFILPLSFHDARPMSLTTVLVRSPPGACETVTSDFGLGGGFRLVLWFPPPVRTGFTTENNEITCSIKIFVMCAEVEKCNSYCPTLNKCKSHEFLICADYVLFVIRDIVLLTTYL